MTTRSFHRSRRTHCRTRPRLELLEERRVLAGAFAESVAFSGLTEPTVVRFADDGRIFVAEKSGLIKVFDDINDSTADTFADLRTNVHNFWDRGLLGMDLHPSFPATPYVYVLYAHDAAIGGTAPVWGTAGATSDPCPNPPGATADGCVVSGRLSRLEASGNTMIGPEQVLIEDWGQQYPSHSIGTIEFGPDGALYASGGDGASFNFVDYGQDGNPVNPLEDPPVPVGGTQTPPTAEGGALRSQDLRTAGDPVSLDGTVIRVDDLGAPLPDNPMIGDADVNAQRAIAYGLRNPFRFSFRPGTHELWSGDVGWGTYEEINVADVSDQVVDNFGWPCYEGPGNQPGYDGADLDICENLYTDTGAHHVPFFAYHHADQVDQGSSEPTGSSSIAGIEFYEGGSYPNTYDNALFFADYSRDRIWVMFPGADGVPDPTTATTFVGPAANPVNLQIGPGGDLFYPDFNGGTIRRIEYFTDNTPPTAIAQATPTNGASPLTVDFDASASFDPDAGDVLTFAWDLDQDGEYDDSTLEMPSFTYAATGTYVVGLEVTDQEGFTDTDTVTISVDSGPPVAVIDTPSAGFTWQVGETISFSGHATDPDEGPLPDAALSWSLLLHHCPANCHIHSVTTFEGVSSGSFDAPDHEYYSYLELILTATDSDNLTGTQSLILEPETVQFTMASDPPGLDLVLNAESATAPSSHDVIIGSTNSISAPNQTVGSVDYEFVSWSDGSAQAHNVIAGSTNQTFTATYLTHAYQQDSGPDNIVSIESTAYDANTANGNHDWTALSDGNATLGAAMRALPDAGTNNNTGYAANSPRLDFDVNFVTTGTHYIWIRGMAPPTSGSNDSIHIGIDGAEVATSDRISGFNTSYGWSNDTMDSAVATIDVNSTGVRTINAWMREDGFVFDKLLLTTSSSFSPSGDGPSQSPRLNRAPISADDSYATSMDVTLSVAAPGVLSNDQDPDSGDTLSVDSLLSDVQHGSLTLDADGSFQYVPNAGFEGSDSFTYQASDGTAPGNVATVTITVGGILEAHFDSGAEGFTYLDDSFRATNDPAYASGAFLPAGGLTGGGLQVLLGGINDADILGMSGGWRQTFALAAPTDVTVSLQYNLTQTSPYESDELSQALLSVDGVLYGTSPDEFLAQIVGDGNGGGDLTTGWQTFSVNVGALGVGTHTLTIGGYNNKKTYNDESTTILIDDVQVTGLALNNPPTANDDSYNVDEDQQLIVNAASGVLQNDSDSDPGDMLTVLGVVDDVSNGTLTLDPDGALTYTPDPDFNGTDTFTYQATDGTSPSNVATVTIEVAPINDAPIAVNDSYNAVVDQQLSVPVITGVLANDIDVDGDSLSVSTLVSDVTNGTLILNSDGSFNYTPSGGFEGTDSFTYDATDRTATSNVVTVTITVAAAVNDPPVAVDDSYSVNQDTVLNVNAASGVLANDSDPESDPLTAVEMTGPANGTLLLNPDGSFDYTPDAGFSGTDTFTYLADDGPNSSNTATVTIRVVGPTLRTGMVTNAATNSWVTVNLDHDYSSLVVVATPSYVASSAPMVTRVRNASGSSFQVKLDRADGQAGAITGVTIHYLAAEAGVYTQAQHGVNMEVAKFTSTVTDHKGSFVGTARSYSNSYANPVVLGQVMTHNDPEFSVFWTRGSSVNSPPTAATLFVGKHVAEDTNTTRAPEEIGYVVIQAGTGTVGGRPYTAQLGADTVRGVTNSPPYTYALSGLVTASTAVASQAAMDGNNGGWSVLYGSNPVSGTQLQLAVDEDQIGDAERSHTTEQIAYLVLEDVQGSATAATLASENPLVGDFNGDQTVDADDLELIGQGTRSQDTRFDVDANGVVDRVDFEIFTRRVFPVVLGDANLDGEFDNADLVHVFQAGEYEDDVDGNSGWSEGDWSGDGDFNSQDILLAFQKGTFGRRLVAAAQRAFGASHIATALVNDATSLLRHSEQSSSTDEPSVVEHRSHLHDRRGRPVPVDDRARASIFAEDDFVSKLRASDTDEEGLSIDRL